MVQPLPHDQGTLGACPILQHTPYTGASGCREERNGVCTTSSLCTDAQERFIIGCEPGKVDIAAINEQVHQAMHTLNKKSYSAGFYVYIVTQAAQDGFIGTVKYNQKESGGFRDVGNHTTAECLPTCWPLVQQVFHFLAQVCACHLQ